MNGQYQNAVNTQSYDRVVPTDYQVADPRPQEVSPEPARPINIQPLNHGFLVNIGCQSFAATDVDEMIDKLKVYLKNPWETEKLWFEKRDLTLIK